MNEMKARILLGALPIVVGVLGVVPYLLAWSTFPDQIASHFTSGGVPDGKMSPFSFLFVNIGWFVAGCALCVGLAVLRRPLFPSVAMAIAATGAFLVALPAAILIETAISQGGLQRWQDASSNVPLMVLMIFGLALPAAAAAGRLVTFLPAREQVIDPEARPVMDLSLGEHAVWNKSIRSMLGTWLAVASTLMAVVVGFATGQWFAFLGLLGCAFLILTTANVAVRVDRGGLHVRFGFLPWPRMSIAVGDITSAAVIDVRPKEWGGWGYRGSLRLMKRAAVVMRAGPGIRLDLHNGKVFVVTIDDPETAVALLNAEVHRHMPANA